MGVKLSNVYVAQFQQPQPHSSKHTNTERGVPSEFFLASCGSSRPLPANADAFIFSLLCVLNKIPTYINLQQINYLCFTFIFLIYIDNFINEKINKNHKEIYKRT